MPAKNLETNQQALDSQLSNVWSLHLLGLEKSGRMSELAQAFTPHQEITLRAKAAIARALVFMGENEAAHLVIHELKNSSNFLENLECRAVVLLAESMSMRKKSLWNLAKWKALRAFILAKQHADKALEADALFAVAFCHNEMGRSFLAVDCYQLIRENTSATPYRRGLAALNEAWIMWDQGRWRSIQKLVEELPESFRPRVSLMLNMVQLDQPKINDYIYSENADLYVGERRQSLLLALETFFVLEQNPEPEVFNADHWIMMTATDRDLEEGSDFWVSALKALLNHQPISLETLQASTQNDQDLRSRIEKTFLVCLSFLKIDVARARQIYEYHLNPLLVQLDLNTPLIPRWDELDMQTSAWGRLLTAKLHGKPQNHDLVSSKKTSVHLDESTLTILKADGSVVKINFDKKSQSWRALQILASSADSEISKRDIHEQLTGNRYLPHLHDDRIQKLYKRLENEIFKQSGLRLWAWPGNNHIKILAKINAQ